MNDKDKFIIVEMENEDSRRIREKQIEQNRKKMMKKTIILIAKPFIIMGLIVFALMITLSASLYYVHLYDVGNQEDDWGNLPFVSDKSLEWAKVFKNGEFETGLSAQQMWDILLDEDGRINYYLDSPAELKKLLNAELVTQYIDTRPNPDEPIDWDAINNDVDSRKVQGIVKLKRQSPDDGSKSSMTYVDPVTFQSYIDEYNETGSEEAKEKALSHFTLGKEEEPLNIKNPEKGTDGTADEIKRGITIMIPQGEGIGLEYDYLDWQSLDDVGTYEYKLKKEAGVTFDDDGFGRIEGRYVVQTTSTFGTVGDYIDYYLVDGTIIPCIIGGIIDSTQSGVNSWGTLNGKRILKFLVDRKTWTTKEYAPGGEAETMHVRPATNGFKMEWNKAPKKVVIGGNYFENTGFIKDERLKDLSVLDKGIKIAANQESIGIENDKIDKIEHNDKIDKIEFIDTSKPIVGGWNYPAKPPYTNTEITSPFGDRNLEEGSKYHEGIDINTTEAYAAAGGIVHIVMNAPSAGNMIEIDHGNGFITHYDHLSNDLLKYVQEGQYVVAGQMLAHTARGG